MTTSTNGKVQPAQLAIAAQAKRANAYLWVTVTTYNPL